MKNGGLSIGALSKQSGVNIETVRYYEKIGIMPAPARSAGGYRVYTSEHLKRLGFVRRGRQLGFSLDELRGLLRMVDGHARRSRSKVALPGAAPQAGVTVRRPFAPSSVAPSSLTSA